MPLKYSGNSFDYLEYFQRSVPFLSEHRWIIEHSNTKFVQAGVLCMLPRAWIHDLKLVTNEELNHIPLGYISETWCDSLKCFIQTVTSLSVDYERICDREDGKSKTVAKGISPKKLYEIRNLTHLIGEICDRNETLLDFGSGLGYLSQSLNSCYKFKVLGLEGDSYRVQASQQRQSNLFPGSSEHVKYVQHFIQEDSFGQIQDLLVSSFKAESKLDKYAIIGLHACADLSVTAIKMFLTQDSITKLTIMPCCYHKLDLADSSSNFKNFPISNQLRDVIKQSTKFIGRPFLRLGCQQTAARWKTMTSEEHSRHGSAMFERSLVEAVLEPGQTVTKRKHVASEGIDSLLDQYKLMEDASSKCNAPWNDGHRKKLEELESKYPEGGLFAEYLTCLQTCLQPLCENLILLDRMCYIEEEAQRLNKAVQCNLVKFTNDDLSPRCFVITAIKNYSR